MNETDSHPGGPARLPVDVLRRRFAQQLTAFESSAARVREAREAGAVRELESCVRTLEAMTKTWAGLIDGRPRRAVLRTLRRLERRLWGALELQAMLARLEPAVSDAGEPVAGLVDDLRTKLSRRTARALKRLRPAHVRALRERLEAATAGLCAAPGDGLHALDRARAWLLGRRAVARVAVELALEREDDWLLDQAHTAVRKWRHALDCMDGAGALHDGHPAPRRLEEALGAIHDQAALIATVERRRRSGDQGLEPLIAELKAEKQAAFPRFQALAAEQGSRRSAPVRVRQVAHRPIRKEAAVPPADGTDERWERMAQWLLGKGSER